MENASLNTTGMKCDGHNFKDCDDALQAMRGCGALVIMARSYALTKEERSKAYEVIHVAVPFFKSAYKALRAAFPDLDEEAAERLAVAYRRWVSRKKERENATDGDTGQPVPGHKTQGIGIDEILEAISSIDDLSLLNMVAEHIRHRVADIGARNKVALRRAS